MAIRKVVGIETEYGIVLRGTPDANPIAASSMLINAYVSAFHRRVGWDFDDEHPGTDARGWLPDDAFPPEVETHLVNAVLTNGARYYVDHAHPEISTPECIDAREIVRFDRAAEVIVQRSMERAAATLAPGAELVAYKNNSDGKGNSYGCHENYLVDRAVPFGRLVAQITPHFVTRQIYCGSGKVGCELPGIGAGDVPFQISQRADFFEEEVGLETTLKRPIVNTRDEPHADQTKYRRLHVIVGDANLSEISTFLKVGTTAMVLAMIEDGVAPDDLALAKPVLAIKDVSWDVNLQKLLPLKDGRKLRALDMQWQLFEKAEKWAQERGMASVGEEVGAEVLQRWERVLTALEVDPMSLSKQLDWVAKYRLVLGFQDRHSLAWGDARLRAIDLQYHDMRPERSLFARVGMETLISDEDVESATTEPPTTTRAYFRGRCLAKWPDDIVAANWDSMVFDIGRDPLRRVPMMEPLRGTADLVGSLIDECATAAELLDRLGS
jgi:proteasome accessory factor PafA2